MNAAHKKSIGPDEIAAELDISARQARVLLEKQKIPGGFRAGRFWRIEVKDFEAYVAKAKADAAAAAAKAKADDKKGGDA